MKFISVIGSCVAAQVIKQMPGHGGRYVQTATKKLDNRFLGKISSNFVLPGKIADRLDDDMRDIAYLDTGLSSLLQKEIRTQLEYVTKPKSIETTLLESKSIASPAAIYVDFTNELLPSVITQDEEFLLKPNWDTLSPYFPDWFREVVRKNVFQFDMYDTAMTMNRYHNLRRAINLINANNQPVVMLGNVYTNRVFDHTSNSIVENLSFYNDKIPFLKVDRTGQLDETINYNYIKRQIDGFYRKCQEPKITPGWNWVNCEEDCYADLRHEFGPHPTHLHITSRKVIGAKLEEAFDKEFLFQTIKNPGR